jgi:hypothetical protein
VPFFFFFFAILILYSFSCFAFLQRAAKKLSMKKIMASLASLEKKGPLDVGTCEYRHLPHSSNHAPPFTAFFLCGARAAIELQVSCHPPSSFHPAHHVQHHHIPPPPPNIAALDTRQRAHANKTPTQV